MVNWDHCDALLAPRLCCHTDWKCFCDTTSDDVAVANIIPSSAELVCVLTLTQEPQLTLCSRDGPDGEWSTFTLRVGTPAQNVRVLISTASQSTWVVVPEGCGESDASCQEARGATFDYNVSSTWAQQGYGSLLYEQNLGLDGDGLWGNDTLGLGVQGSGGPTLNNQAIAGIKTNDFYVGMFGVNPKPIKNTGLGTQQDSYMASLKKQSFIPSIAFGYTAGAQYRKFYSETEFCELC